jgi:hypothetical protein
VRYDNESIATHDKQTLTAVSTTKLSNLVRDNLTWDRCYDFKNVFAKNGKNRRF